MEFYRSLRFRGDIYRLYNSIVGQKFGQLTPEEMREFLEQTQGRTFSNDEEVSHTFFREKIEKNSNSFFI